MMLLILPLIQQGKSTDHAVEYNVLKTTDNGLLSFGHLEMF